MNRFSSNNQNVTNPNVSNRGIPLILLTQLLLTGLLIANSAFAEKPSWAGDGKEGRQSQTSESRHNQPYNQDQRSQEQHGKQQRSDDYREARKSQQRTDDRRDDRDGREDRHRDGGGINVYFGEQHRAYVHDYYQPRFHEGRCPPGLAKRHNGCLPPGQERRWRMGYPLPRDVIYYDLPPSVVIQLGPPPPRHRYVRVAADILLIAIGTGMVVDAIEDIGDH